MGRSVAVRLAREGYRLVLGDIDAPPLRRTAAELGPEHVVSVVDVAARKRRGNWPWRRSAVWDGWTCG